MSIRKIDAIPRKWKQDGFAFPPPPASASKSAPASSAGSAVNQMTLYADADGNFNNVVAKIAADFVDVHLKTRAAAECPKKAIDKSPTLCIGDNKYISGSAAIATYLAR